MDAGILVSVSSSATKVPYDDVKYDPGNSYNTATHEYTAPLRGYYFVTSHLFGRWHVATQHIRVNGSPVLKDHMYDHDELYVATEPSVVLKLNAGDKLSVTPDFTVDGGITGGNILETWLSVALLYIE